MKLSLSALAIRFLLFFLFLASISNFLPVWHWAQDINRNFIPVYFYLQLVALPLILFQSRRKEHRTFRVFIALAFLLMSFSYGAKLLPHYSYFALVAEKIPEKRGQKISLAFSVASQSGELEQSLASIGAKMPDVSALVLPVAYNTDDVLPDYLHRVKVSNDRGQLLLLSKFPMETGPVFSLGEDLYNIIFAEMKTQTSSIKFGLFEVPAVRSASSLRENKIILRRFAMQLRHSKEDSIILSDLKLSPFSSLFGSFAYAADLTNAARGYGFPSTGACAYPIVNCSHILYKGLLEVINVKSEENVLFAEFVVKAEALGALTSRSASFSRVR